MEMPALPDIPEVLRVLPLEESVLYPYMLLPLVVSQENNKKLVEDTVSSDRFIGAFAVINGANGNKLPELYKIGSAGMIHRMLRIPDGSMQIFMQGIKRVRIRNIVQQQPYIMAEIEPLDESYNKTIEAEGILRKVISQFHEIIKHAPYLPPEVALIVENLGHPSQQIDFIASNLNLKKEEHQQLLEKIDVTERSKLLMGFLDRELEILKIGSKIHEQIHQTMDKSQREYYLRQQLEAIKKELGETDEQTAIINELRQKIEKANLPEDVSKETKRELDRMSQIPTISPEYNVSRTYLDWIISLPWSIGTEDNLNVNRAQQVLDEDHHDLEKVKERIVDYLAVRQLKKDMKGPILCFVGPPGTGKTSLGKSIARTLERKFVRMSLGGIRDEAEIRGHRRTYIGALPGRIIQSLRRAESNNPVMMLDEIDKVGIDFRGDPASALLEVLDPEQNNTFVDHYLDVPFDLSKILFIATANVMDTIPTPLLDRMEVLQLSGYTEPQKIEISKKYLIPKQIEEHGLKESNVLFEENAIAKIIRNYAREAGVRNLERNIASVCRKTARQIATGTQSPIHVTEKEVRDILGPERFLYDVAEEKDEIGVVVGMAWTPTGGDILFVEASVVPGKGNLRITGRLGDVMKESAEAAFTFVRSRAQELGLVEDFYSKWDVHIHVPEGAVPKDGPSAGVTMTTALASAFTKRAAKKEVAMTGEITLRGKVLPIGGVRDKVLAAHRAGIKTVILPKENERDLEEVPDHVKNTLKFEFVENLDQVLNIALMNSSFKKNG
ncbi:MAG: endopeptidase La [bacterium]|nr:MAG: endopeptidase La [bacterium]